MPEQEPTLERYQLKRIGGPEKIGGPSLPSGWAWPGPDPSELGHPVPVSFVLARSTQASLGITGLVAYSNGFRFAALAALTSADDGASLTRQVADQSLAAFPRALGISSLFLLRLEFSDQTTADNTGANSQGEKEVRWLKLLGASGGGTRWNWDWFLSPLPPPGAITFVCEWPQLGLQGKYEIASARQILSAAKKSQRFFA